MCTANDVHVLSTSYEHLDDSRLLMMTSIRNSMRSEGMDSFASLRYEGQGISDDFDTSKSSIMWLRSMLVASLSFLFSD
jgi:hypothetical protein